MLETHKIFHVAPICWSKFSTLNVHLALLRKWTGQQPILFAVEGSLIILERDYQAVELGLVNLTKVLIGAVLGYLRFFHQRSESCALAVFFSLCGMQWVSSRSEGGAIRLVRCPRNLCVAFNKIINEVQGCKAAGQSAAYGPWTNPLPAASTPEKKNGKNFRHGT